MVRAGFIVSLMLAAVGGTAEASETELLLMGGYHTVLEAKVDDGPQDVSYRGYLARATLTSSDLAIGYKVPGRLGFSYESALYDRPNKDDDPLVADAILTKTYAVEWVIGVFDFPFQIDAAAGWMTAEVNLGAVDKVVPYQGANLRVGGQLTFGEHLVYFLRAERSNTRIYPTNSREEGESLQPVTSWLSTPVLIGIGYRN